jgi:quinoprotein glucose dehydrogenase
LVPGEKLSPTQPFPTKPAPLEELGLSEENVIDFTPELKQEALEIMSQYRIGGPYSPFLPEGHTENVKGWIACSGGVNITHPAVLDPEMGILYQSSGPQCSGRLVQPGSNSPFNEAEHGCTSSEGTCETTGVTVSDWVVGGGVGWGGPQGLPIHKPPYSRITAIDMNTGDHLWWIPVGEPPEQLKRHPALQGVDLPGAGVTGRGRAIMMATGSLLLATEGTQGRPVLNAHDKRSGEKLGSIDLPAQGQYGMMTYEHEGRQHIVVQIGQGGEHPGSLAAFALPAPGETDPHE